MRAVDAVAISIMTLATIQAAASLTYYLIWGAG